MLRKSAVIRIQEALNYWQGLNPFVELTEERMEHIRQHHPDDFELCVSHIETVIENPDLILEDHKNPFTAMFISSFTDLGVNVVIKLALSNDPKDRSFIVTVHPVGERSIHKLEKKNKVIYKKTPTMV